MISIKYEIRESPFTLSKELYCIFEDKKYIHEITQKDLIELFDRGFNNVTTATKAAIIHRNQKLYFENLYHKILKYFRLDYMVYTKDHFRADCLPVLMEANRYRNTGMINYGTKTFQEEKKEEELKVPVNIRDALELQEFIMRKQKEIMKNTKEVRKRRLDYYKKHGTLIEKGTEYMEYIFKK